MSSSKMTVFLKKIDWLLPNGAVSVRIAPENTPGSISPGEVPLRKWSRPNPRPARRRRKPKGRKNLRKHLFSRNPFHSTHVGDKISCEDVIQSDEVIATVLHRSPTTSQPEPYSPALSSTSFLVPSPVPSSFVSSPSPSLFMDSPPSSPCVASPVSPAPEPSSAPAIVHPTPLPHVPVQAPSSQLVMGPTPPLMSPSLIIEKVERFNELHNYYISNYNKMTHDAKCYAYYWCQKFWDDFMSSAHIAKQQRNGNSEAYYSYGDNEGAPATESCRLDENEIIFPSDVLDQLSDIPGVLEMAVEMGYL
ncbi:uncharacterized protein [Paramormyrops kingsleyae]